MGYSRIIHIVVCISSLTFPIMFGCNFSTFSNISSSCPTNCTCHTKDVYCNSSLISVLNGSLDKPEHFLSLNNTQVNIFDLSYNGIAEIKNRFFERLNITIHHLRLSHNNLTEISGLEIKGIVAKFLYLSHNCIHRISPYAFDGNVSCVEGVDLSYNRLTYFEPWPFTKNNRISTFNFSHNHISSFRNTPNLTIVDILKTSKLGVNKLVDLTFNNFSVWIIDSLKDVYHFDDDPDTVLTMKCAAMGFLLQNNPWRCDCLMYEFRHLLQSDTFMLPKTVREQLSFNCVTPQRLRGQNALDVPVTELVCPVLGGCPTSCQCQKVPAYKYTRVVCSSLVSFPDQMPSGPLFLNFSWNRISKLEFRSYLSSVTYLDLSNNRLHVIEGGAAQHMGNIAMLNLASNQLTTLPKEIQVVRFSNVHLEGNKLHCSCDLTWVSDWIDVRSDDPANQRSVCYKDGLPVTLSAMQDNIDCVSDLVVPVTVGVSITVTMVILAAVACRVWGRKKLPFVMYLIRGRKVQPVHRYDDQEAEFDYHGYLSFDNDNMDIVLWVKNVLLENLENNDEGFRICCPLRDFDVGVSQAEEILDNIDKSKRFISIVSDTYFNPLNWTSFEYDQAQHKHKDHESNIIMVVYDNIDVDNVRSEAAKNALNRKEYLRTGDNLFWQKLKFLVHTGNKMF
ncbi:protein toll-like [Haliotis rubra]|uniref:protein toll-like n=1 Tax=Haliotis rubra TaxID=36100 RepID=UPI001EE4EB8B|nr:protein toll-like [Haliotis rubra]